MDLQNGDNEERRVKRKTTVLTPLSLLVQPNILVNHERRYPTRKIAHITSHGLVPEKPRQVQNTVKRKSLKLTYISDIPRGISQNIVRKNNVGLTKTANKMSDTNKFIATIVDITKQVDLNEKEMIIEENAAVVDQSIQENSGTERRDMQTISNDILQKATENSSDKSIRNTILQNIITRKDIDAGSQVSKKSAQTLRYMKKQRYARKQELKNEYLMKERMKEQRRICLENLQIMSKKILQNNIVNKSKKNILPSSVKEKEADQSEKKLSTFTLPEYPRHASFARKVHSPPSDKISLQNKETVSEADTANPDENISAILVVEGEQEKEDICSNKKRIKLDENSINHADLLSRYGNEHIEKKKKTELILPRNLNTSHMSVGGYPYNLIAAVENKLSITLSSPRISVNEPYSANNASSNVNLFPGKNENNNNEKHFLNDIESLYGMENIHDICTSSKTQVLNYNLTERYKNNKSWSKSLDNKKNFYGVKKVIKSKPPLLSNKNFMCQIQTLTNLNNKGMAVSLEDILDSKNHSYSMNDSMNNSKDIPMETFIITHNSVQSMAENEKCISWNISAAKESSHKKFQELPSAETNNCSDNSLKTPNLNLIFAKKSNDSMVKIITETDVLVNEINSSFKNELTLLNSFNESLRHIQMVEDTLSSIRKSEDRGEVLDSRIIKKSILKPEIDNTIANERFVNNTSPINPVITKFNIFTDTCTSSSPSLAKSRNTNFDSMNELFSAEEKIAKKRITSQMLLQTTIFKKDKNFNTTPNENYTKQSIQVNSCELKPSSITHVDKASECDIQIPNKISEHQHKTHIKNAKNREPPKNCLARDNNIEGKIEQVFHDATSLLKSEQPIQIDSCTSKPSSISQVDQSSERDSPNKKPLNKSGENCKHDYDHFVKNATDQESTENSLAYDSNAETGIEHLLHDTSFSFKSMSNNSKNLNQHLLSHMNRFCVFMMSQYVEDEKVRSEYLELFLRVREKTLMDATRSEILLLEIQKKYSQEQVPYLKKKQRGLLVKLQQERNEIKNIKKFQHERSNERKNAIKRQLKYFKTIFTSDTNGKEINKTVNRSNLLVHSKSIARNSPIKAFSLSMSTDSNSHDSSLSHINEIIQKKKIVLAKQKKKMNELLLSHYDLQMDAAEIKAIGDRIKDSKRRPLRDFSDLRNSIDRALQENNFSMTRQETNIVNRGEDEKSEVSSPISTPKQVNSFRPSDIISSHPNAAIIETPNNFGILPSLNLAKISIAPKSCETKEKQAFTNEYNLKASSISLNIMSIPNPEESTRTDQSYGLVNGSNLNMLWRKITGEQVDKYSNSDYYEMSEEKLNVFFEGAKHAALQNLLRPNTFDEVKNEINTTPTDSSTPNGHADIEPVELKEQALDNTLKSNSSFNHGIHYSLKGDMTLSSRSESKKNLIKSNSSNYINSADRDVNEQKINSKESLETTHFENIDTSKETNLSSVNLTNTNPNEHTNGSIHNLAKENSDQSDSSESTARSLIDELVQFHNLVHMNSSYTDECDKSSTMTIPDSILPNSNDTHDTASQKTVDSLVKQINEVDDSSHEKVSMQARTESKDTQQSTDDACLCASNEIDNSAGNKLSNDCNSQDKLEIVIHDNVVNEANVVINIDKKEIDDTNCATKSNANKKLDACDLVNVIEWNDLRKSNDTNLIQPISVEKCKPNKLSTHKTDIDSVSFQNDCRLLNQLVNNSTHLQEISKQNINPQEKTSLHSGLSQNEVRNDESINIDKSCSDLLKTNGNKDNKNTKNHDLISTTWDLMSSSPEPSPRDSPTGEYSPATAAFSVSLSRIDEELRKKQLAIELEIKALEQQQTQLPYCLVREIPDKPPPPYIPPVEDSKLSISSPKDSTIVGKPTIQVSAAIKTTCKWFWSQYTSGNTKAIDYANFDTNLSKDSHYSIFLFDLCRETFENEISKRKLPSFAWEYKKVKLLRPGKTDICLVVENKVKKFLGLEIWPIKKNLITNWAQKRQDYINELLLKELYKEEGDWANVEEVESEVKNSITDTILESLILEVCKEFNEIY